MILAIFHLPAARRRNGRLALAGAVGESTVWLSVGGCGRTLADLMLTLLTPRQAAVRGSSPSFSACVGVCRFGGVRTDAGLACGRVRRCGTVAPLTPLPCGDSTCFPVAPLSVGSAARVRSAKRCAGEELQILHLLVVQRQRLAELLIRQPWKAWAGTAGPGMVRTLAGATCGGSVGLAVADELS